MVAVAGVLFSFSVLVVIEREREIGVLRALGASKLQVTAFLLAEAILLGLTASLSGLVSGSALAVVLTGVINKAFFGWTIDLIFPFRRWPRRRSGSSRPSFDRRAAARLAGGGIRPAQAVRFGVRARNQAPANRNRLEGNAVSSPWIWKWAMFRIRRPKQEVGADS